MGYYQGTAEIRNEPIVAELQNDMPAKAAGILPGDRIIGINGNMIETWDDLTEIIHGQPNKDMALTIQRKNVQINLNITTTSVYFPRSGGIDTLGAIGIAPDVIFLDMTFNEALGFGWFRTMASFGMIVTSLKMLGSGSASVS